MDTRAYILIETKVGKMSQVAGELRSLSGLESVDQVTASYDIVAMAHAPDLSAIGDLVTERIHKIDGVIRTVTCLSIGAD